MAYFCFNNIEVVGIAGAVPKNYISSKDFISKFGSEAVNKSIEITGVRQIRKSLHNQTASDLGVAATEHLLNSMDIKKDDIDGIVYISLSPDYLRPPTSNVIQQRLELRNDCALFDVLSGCAGFVNGLQIASSLIQSSDMNKIILITAETATKKSWKNNRATELIIGDGAAATLVSRTKSFSSIKGLLMNDGYRYKSIIIPGGGFRHLDASSEPYFDSESGNENTNNHIHMNGTEVFEFAVFDVPHTVKDFFKKTESNVDDYDYFAFHQANAFINEQQRKKLKISKNQMLSSIGNFGNTSSASVPLTICHNFDSNNNRNKISILSCGFGIGLSWGVCSFSICPKNIFSVIETDEYYDDKLL